MKKIKDLPLAPMEEIEQVVATQDAPTLSDIKIIGHCETCAFWGVEKEFVCDRINESLDCEFYTKNPMKNDRAVIDISADDDSGLKAEFRTGPKFGCLLYECE